MREVKHFVFVTLLLYLFAAILSAHASDSSQTINYSGQSYDNLSLTSLLKQIEYRDEVIYDTCTRSVPYQDQECRWDTRYHQECRYETRYGQECHFEPGRRVCQTTYENECHTETRYRQVCGPRLMAGLASIGDTEDRGGRNGGGRNGGGRNGGGRNGGGHSGGGTVGGGHSGGGNHGGGTVCRQVPYTERVCRQVPRQRCTQTAGRQVCRQVPRQERVCRQVPRQERICHTVTRYRTETYSCTKTVQRPVEVVVKTITNNINVEFDSKLDAPLNTALMFTQRNNGVLDVSFLSNPIGVVAVVNTKDVKIIQSTGDLEVKETTLQITFREKSKLLSPFQGTMTLVGLDSDSLTLEVSKIFMPKTLRLVATIEENGSTRMAEFNLGQLELDQVDPFKTKFELSFDALGVSLGSNAKLTLELKLKNSGRIVGADEDNLILSKSILL